MDNGEAVSGQPETRPAETVLLLLGWTLFGTRLWLPQTLTPAAVAATIVRASKQAD